MRADKALDTTLEMGITTGTSLEMGTTTDTSLGMDTTTEDQGPTQGPRVAPSVVRDRVVARVQGADLGVALRVDQDLALGRGPSAVLGVVLHPDSLATEDPAVSDPGLEAPRRISLATMEVLGTTAVLLLTNQDQAITEASGTTAVLLPTNPVPIALGDRFRREQPEKLRN